MPDDDKVKPTVLICEGWLKDIAFKILGWGNTDTPKDIKIKVNAVTVPEKRE